AFPSGARRLQKDGYKKLTTLDSNNSYWAEKLHRFKDGSFVFPLNGAEEGHSLASLELKTPASTAFKRTASVYVGALALLAARYSLRDEILIADLWTNKSGAAKPLFYSCEARADQSVSSFLDEIDAEIQVSLSRVPYSYEDLASLLHLNERSAFEISF